MNQQKWESFLIDETSKLSKQGFQIGKDLEELSLLFWKVSVGMNEKDKMLIGEKLSKLGKVSWISFISDYHNLIDKILEMEIKRKG